MKIVCLTVAIVLVSSLAAAQNVLKMPLVDRSASGSPIENAGTITLTERITDNKSHDSKNYQLQVTNKSQKPILALVEWVTITYPSGFGEKEVVEKDTFFGRKTIEPGDPPLDFSSYGDQGDMVFDMKGALRPAHCEVQAMYVQFVDSTEFGDGKYGQELLARRQQIWNMLAHLNVVFQKSGEEQFVKELQKPVQPPAVNGFFDMFRSSQKEDGTQAAVDMIVRVLNRAEEKSAAMNQNAKR